MDLESTLLPDPLHFPATPTYSRPFSERFFEITKAYGFFAFITFGGPQAHMALLHDTFVTRRKWVTEMIFSELFAICQVLPGPLSTELAYSLALIRGGWVLAIWGFLLWTFPGFIAMTLAGIGVSFLSTTLPPVLTHLFSGVTSAAIGLIFLAAYKLSINLANDTVTRIICFTSAAAAILYSAPWLYPVLMAMGAVVTVGEWLWTEQRKTKKDDIEIEMVDIDNDDNMRTEDVQIGQTTSSEHVRSDSTLRQRVNNTIPNSPEITPGPSEPSGITSDLDMYTYSWKIGLAFLALWFIILMTSVILKSRLAPDTSQLRIFAVFETFYIVGSIILGGGPVVVPLLQGYVVDNGWVSNRDFLIGLALINVIPGPNFNFAAYCGVLAMRQFGTIQAILGAFVAYVGIFFPGLLLKNSVLPIWQFIRGRRLVKVVFRGVNAAAVGLVFAAVWLLWRQAIETPLQNGTFTSGGVVNPGIYNIDLYVVLGAFAFLATEFLGVHIVVPIVVGAVVGVLEWVITK